MDGYPGQLAGALVLLPQTSLNYLYNIFVKIILLIIYIIKINNILINNNILIIKIKIKINNIYYYWKATTHKLHEANSIVRSFFGKQHVQIPNH